MALPAHRDGPNRTLTGTGHTLLPQTAVFEQLGYDVTAETDSLRALEIFRSRPGEFDLVITDYTMPNRTGIDLSR